MDEERQEEKILTTLSMNGRAPAKLIGKLTEITPQKAYRKVRSLEDRYKIKYIAEINIEKLGYLKFIILIKFATEIPLSDSLKDSLSAEVNVQYGALLRGGDYDLILYVLAENVKDISYICSRLRRKTILSEYPAEWYISPFYESYGFMPLRDEFIESLNEKVINKGKKLRDTGKNKRIQIQKREFATLRELNSNGSADLLDIDKKYGFDTGRVQYAYYKLLEDHILKRITITLQYLPIKYVAAIFVKVIDQKSYYATRDSVLKEIISENSHFTNKYALVGDITTPFGILALMPIFNEEDLEKALSNLKHVKGAIIKGGVITTTFMGKLSYRKFDNSYAEQTEFLQRDFKIKAPRKIEYTEKRRYYKIKTASDEFLDI